MEQNKLKVVQRLKELKAVKFIEPTAMELRSSRPGLSRVYRQEMKRYKEKVEKQKILLAKKLVKINKYLESKRKYDSYLTRRSAFLQSEEERVNQLRNGNMGKNGNNVVVTEIGTFGEIAPIVLKTPSVVMGIRPAFRDTRLSRVKRRGRRVRY